MFGEYEVPLAFNAVGTIGMLVVSGLLVWWYLRKQPAPNTTSSRTVAPENDMSQTERIETLEKLRAGGLIDDATFQMELRKILESK